MFCLDTRHTVAQLVEQPLCDREEMVGWGKGVSCILITGASNSYWLTVGQDLLALQQVRVEGGCFYFLLFLHFHSFSFLPCPFLSSLLLSLLSLFSLSVGDDTKWPTGVDVSLNPNSFNQLWPGDCGFDPQPSHTKDFKSGTSCSFARLSALRK